MHRVLVFLFPLLSPLAAAPRFDPTASLRGVLVPADAAVGSVMYRLRASDTEYAYPLIFEIPEPGAIASVISLNCSRFNSVCQANVILAKKLEPGRYYDFRVTVRNTKGVSAALNCSLRATNSTTPIAEIFPGAPTLLMVSENARRNTELGSIIAKGNQNGDKPVLLELWGSPQFSLRQKLVNKRDAEGTIILLGQLDYETTTVHHLTILANDPYGERDNDTRNIAAWALLVAVLDEQDTPPVFTLAPPTTALDPALKPGDIVLRVKAEDGDKGKPRDIRYGLVSEGSPFTSFFNLSEETGELRLIKPLAEIQAISHSNTPILLTVLAEEVRSSGTESPAQSSTIRLALIPPPSAGSTPRFTELEYTTNLDENAAPGTILDLPKAELLSEPGSLYTLELLNNNGTFDISPNVIEGKSRFMIKVRDNALLDYESRKSVRCNIYAKEIGEGTNRSAITRLIVNLKDINDNPPKFNQKTFQTDIPENAPKDSSVLRVKASDIDGKNEKVRYTRLYGQGSEYFSINPESGLITVKKPEGLDSEKMSTLTFFVEATDSEKGGNAANATITINLIDINDETPQFEKSPYEFILNPDRKSFTLPAFVKANDNDSSSPNNDVHYELIGVYENITLDEATGELTIRSIWNRDEIVTLKARAYDGGIPHLWSECEIRLYPPEGVNRKMIFIISGSNTNKRDIEDYLSGIVGGKVLVQNVKPYNGNTDEKAIFISKTGERSVIETTVPKNTAIDLNRIHETIRDMDRHHDEEIIKKSSSSTWWWLLLVLLLLLILFCLLLILCCILEGCPLYVAPKRRRKVTPTDAERLVIKREAPLESKSVQVAEWFGRKEAWTPEHHMIDVEVDSLRRHEMDRGSERGAQRQKHTVEAARDQYYIREGNTDILRLVTRGGDQQQQQQRPVTLIPEQAYFIDSGKDILMRRFIEQQQSERVNAFQQSTLHRIQSEHEILEASLRQQNALLRQILSERERDLRLETQSLPAGTQTDQNVSTQTEPLFLRPPRRQTRSDNDASDGSDEEIRYIKAKRRRNVRKASVKRKIRTPIQEESESNENIDKPTSEVHYTQTKTSILRKMKADSERSKSSSVRSKSSLRKEILQEISDSLNQTDSDSGKRKEKTYYYSDSLEDDSPRSEQFSGKERRLSENVILEREITKPLKQSHSTTDLSKAGTSTSKLPKKSSARYMEWYNKNGKEPKKVKKKEIKIIKDELKTKEDIKPTATKVSKRLLSDTQSSARKKIESSSTTVPGPEHPLIQHSKNRFEVQAPKRTEEDGDSGIALTRPTMAQKKSVFTIAYDDMQTKQIPESVSTTP